MISSSAIFVIVTVALLATFVYETIRGISRAGIETARPDLIAAPNTEPQPVHALKILLATDGSPCSDHAAQSVAMRQWPPGSEFQVVSVIHTNVPFVAEPTLTGVAGYEQALESDRRDAPIRVQKAERFLAGLSALPVETKVRRVHRQVPDLVVPHDQGRVDRWRAEIRGDRRHPHEPRVVHRARHEGGHQHNVLGVLNDGTPIKSVEAKVDDGAWQLARLDPATKDKYGWKLFTYIWTGATSGDHVIVSRATDATGRVQPTEEELATKKSFLEHNAQAPRKIKIA